VVVRGPVGGGSGMRQRVTSNPPDDVVGDLAGSPSRSGRMDRQRGALLAEQHDEWTEGRRHLGLDILARSRVILVPTPPGRFHEGFGTLYTAEYRPTDGIAIITGPIRFGSTL